MSGVRLPADFLVCESGAPYYQIAGGVEYGFMSATVDGKVAKEYAGKGGSGVLYEIQQGMGARGADLSWLSQYPGEAEICYFGVTVIFVEQDVAGFQVPVNNRQAVQMVQAQRYAYGSFDFELGMKRSGVVVQGVLERAKHEFCNEA